jgi:hypothetical protein
LFTSITFFSTQANIKSSPLAVATKNTPKKKRKKEKTKGAAAPSTPKKGGGQGIGGGRPVGSKMLTSPGGTKTYIAPTGSDSSRAKRKLVGADVIPSSTSSTIRDEACANAIQEAADLRRKLRKAVKQTEATEKVSVTYITQLQELVQARDRESEMMLQMLKDTPLSNVPIFKRPGIPEPSWFSEVKVRLQAAEAAALKGVGFDLDDE